MVFCSRLRTIIDDEQDFDLELDVYFRSKKTTSYVVQK